MIRLLHLISDTNIGGAGMWVCKYASRYDRERFSLTVAVPRGSALVPRLSGLPCRVIEADMEGDRSLSPGSIPALVRLIKSERPHILHTHGSLSGRIAGRLAGGCRIVYTKHTLDAPLSPASRLVRGALDGFFCDRAVAVSEAAAENLRQNGTSPRKIAVIYNGAEPPEPVPEERRESLRREWGIVPGSPVLAMVARMEPVKDHETFLRAAASFAKERPDAVFLLAGGGSLLTRMRELAGELGIAGNCRFLGETDRVGELYAVANAAALTSKSENLPLTVCEAMAWSLPVVATRVGGLPEAAADGESALLCESGDAAALAENMLRLFSEPGLRERLGEAGRRRWERLFTMEGCAKNTEALYDLLLRGRRV